MRRQMNPHWLKILPAVFWLMAGALPAAETNDAQQEEEPSKPRIFFNQNARIVAYQLGRLSNERLLLVDRSPDDPKYKPVYEAILSREDMAERYRKEAVAALAQLNQTDETTELLAAIRRLDSEEPKPEVILELGRLLAGYDPENLSQQAEGLQQLAAQSDTETARRIGYYGLIRSGSVDSAWDQALESDCLHLPGALATDVRLDGGCGGR